MVRLSHLISLGASLGVTSATTLYLAGDSTMAANDGNAAIIGWGTKVGAYLSSSLTIVNDAIAGRSSRTFTTEGHCTYIIPMLHLNLKFTFAV